MKNRRLSVLSRDSIERGIINGDSLKDIAMAIGNDPTTVSKEVKKHRRPIECDGRVSLGSGCRACLHYETCNLHNLCGKQGCEKACKRCTDSIVPKFCQHYDEKTCRRLKRFPYVCNGCQIGKSCNLQKWRYDHSLANGDYLHELHCSRSGADLTPDEANDLSKVVSSGLAKGQSPYIIKKANPDEVRVSARTLYNYIKNAVLQGVAPASLPEGLRKRKKKIPREYEYPENKGISRAGHEYIDFVLYMDKHQRYHYAEMDTVGGGTEGDKAIGYSGTIISIIIPTIGLLIMRKIESKSPDEVVSQIDKVFVSLGKRSEKLLGVITTDRGIEFNACERIEGDSNGVVRCRLFYCDPGVSTQKPNIERINREIRCYIPKGSSVKGINQDDCDFISSEIDSTPVDSMGGVSAYSIAVKMVGEEALRSLGIKRVPPKEIIKKPMALIKAIKSK